MWAFFLQARQYVSKKFLQASHMWAKKFYKNGNMWALQYVSIFVAMWAWYLQAMQYVSKIFYKHLICEKKNSTSMAICEHCNMWAYLLLCDISYIYITKSTNMWAISSQIHMWANHIILPSQNQLICEQYHLLYGIHQYGMAMFINKKLGFHQKSRVPPLI